MIHAYSLTCIILEVVHSNLVTVQCDFSGLKFQCFAQISYIYIYIECFMKQLTFEGDSYFNKTRSHKKVLFFVAPMLQMVTLT